MSKILVCILLFSFFPAALAAETDDDSKVETTVGENDRKEKLEQLKKARDEQEQRVNDEIFVDSIFLCGQLAALPLTTFGSAMVVSSMLLGDSASSSAVSGLGWSCMTVGILVSATFAVTNIFVGDVAGEAKLLEERSKEFDDEAMNF